jgi:endoglucanase
MLGKGFYVILNMHHYNQLFGDALMPNEFAVDPPVLEDRFVNMWRQIALRFHDRSPKLVFELLNEPHGSMTGDAWNLLAAKALAAIRAIDPTRAVIVGPVNYNSIAELAKLNLPPDKNLIVAIHNYDPFAFTHQGATWLPFKLPTGVTCCSIQQRKAVTDAFDIASAWSAKSGYPLHLGEFGSLRGIDSDSREAYTRMVRGAAESRAIGWTYWEFGATFGAYWPGKHAWIEPIRRALLDQ